MKRFNFKFKWSGVRIQELDDRMMLLNLYITQAITLVIALIVLFFQKTNSLKDLLQLPEGWGFLYWGAGFAVLVVLGDLLVSRWVPEDVTDDGGINKLLFGKRALWNIAVMCAVVSVCEELLFRGAIQHAFGAYWTSIIFAAIHVRYLRHWLMTGMVFGVSYGLGWIYVQTGTLWTAIFAHFLIDLIMGCIIRFQGED